MTEKVTLIDRIELGRICFLVLFLTLSALAAMAGNIRGTITDKHLREPLTGATIQVSGTNQDIVAERIKVGTEDLVLNFEMESDAQAIGEVSVVAKKNLEGERALQMERQQATLAIENLGSKEMSLKGIGNVQEGVKKLTGISIADAGQLIVRGLGDRYSTTTLNGLPIASPNPDNKLIPLDLFPNSTVQNITVSKVYNAESFADYSGAQST